jgi:hypothetical protein
VPLETRKLEFSPMELQAALVNYALRRRIPLPKANIDKIYIGKVDAEKVTCRFTPSNVADDAIVEFTNSQVAAALIMYCKSEKIPLPRDADKVLQRNGDTLALIVRVEWE